MEVTADNTLKLERRMKLEGLFLPPVVLRKRYAPHRRHPRLAQTAANVEGQSSLIRLKGRNGFSIAYMIFARAYGNWQDEYRKNLSKENTKCFIFRVVRKYRLSRVLTSPTFHRRSLQIQKIQKNLSILLDKPHFMTYNSCRSYNLYNRVTGRGAE